MNENMSRLLPRLLADKEYFEMGKLQSDLTWVEMLKYEKLKNNSK